MSALPTAAAIDLFLDWLNSHLGTAYATDTSDTMIASDAGHRLAVSLVPLFDAASDASWKRRCAAVVTQLREASPAPVTLWVPPDADLPHGDRTDFNRRIAESAVLLQSGQRGQVEFPVTLTLKKLSDEASYVHVTGGLAPHWARLTGRAFGQYSLDTSAIHRLPEPEQRTGELLDWVALLGNGMKAGASSEIKAEDAWTISRSTHQTSFEIIGGAPGSEPSNGTSVRKLLRTGLKAAASDTPAPGAARALVLVGVYRTLEEENATIALRSCDPTLYGHFDVVCLIADGHCKALVGPRLDVLRSA